MELYNNPANNNTARVLKTLLTEMMSLFPDPVFHIGTDEMIPAETYPSAGPCTTANLRGLEQDLLAHVKASGKVPMAWQDVLVDSGAAVGQAGTVILDTWHKYGKPSFGAGNATALGFEAVESSGMYLVPHAEIDTIREADAFGLLWRDIAAGFTPQQLQLMLGGEVSFWCNNWCSWVGRYGGHSMCDVHGGAGGPPAGARMNSSSLTDLRNDGQFWESSMNIMWPKTAAAAGAMWQHDNASDSSSAAHAAYLAHAERLAGRNITSCPQTRSCSACAVSTKCGRPYS